jgi:hypothetical protein
MELIRAKVNNTFQGYQPFTLIVGSVGTVAIIVGANYVITNAEGYSLAI